MDLKVWWMLFLFGVLSVSRWSIKNWIGEEECLTASINPLVIWHLFSPSITSLSRLVRTFKIPFLYLLNWSSSIFVIFPWKIKCIRIGVQVDMRSKSSFRSFTFSGGLQFKSWQGQNYLSLFLELKITFQRKKRFFEDSLKRDHKGK